MIANYVKPIKGARAQVGQQRDERDKTGRLHPPPGARRRRIRQRAPRDPAAAAGEAEGNHQRDERLQDWHQ